jgi:hypothetical protein
LPVRQFARVVRGVRGGRGGIIREVRVFQEGLPACEVAVIGGDGQVTPKPEWDDHPMASGVDGGWCARFTEHPKLLGGENLRTGRL